jgi:glycosyltransferase involved in cell wall biosynthesis
VALLNYERKPRDLRGLALSKWRLNLYGDGPMWGTLERIVDQLGISDRVTFHGFKDVAHIWARNHALALPSRYEGLPLALVEAMMCGRTAVVTDVAGNSEVIEDGVTGFLADAPTVRSMERTLERFWAQRNDLERMGKAAAARIRELIPPDPVRVFSDKIKELVALKL